MALSTFLFELYANNIGNMGSF